MRTEDIYRELTAIFREVFEDDGLAIGPDTTAHDIAGWDSGRMIELVVAAEARFGARFTTREVDGMQRVADFVAIIQKHAGKDTGQQAAGRS